MSENKSEKGIGSVLKEARQSKNISVEEASKNTRIHVNILKSMENDDFKSLGTVYAKSFLKLYAEYLSLDKESLMQRFQGSLSDEEAGSVKKIRILGSQATIKGRGIPLKVVTRMANGIKKIDLRLVSSYVLFQLFFMVFCLRPYDIFKVECVLIL